jgi:haloalkane dehalogenase
MSDSRTKASIDWRQLYPFKSHWIDSDAGRMHYIDEGPISSNGRPAPECLLFVHGNPTWSFHWRRLILALRDRYRCIAPDHLGCGLSDKPRQFMTMTDHVRHLLELINELSLERVTLVAQDWGGAIGLSAMVPRRDLLQRVVLFNTAAFTPRYIPWRIRACRFPIFGRLAVQGANLFSRAALRMTLARLAKLDPEVEAGYLYPCHSWVNRQAVYGFVRDIPAPRGAIPTSFDEELASEDSTFGALAVTEWALPKFADRPSCLIWGMQDWCFRPDCLQRFIEAWPRAEVHRLMDVGHWVVEDAPDDALNIVTQFLERTSEDLPQRHEGHEDSKAAAKTTQ